MKDLLFVLLRLAVTTAKLCRPGGARAVIGEDLLLKQQRWDRLLCGFWSLYSVQDASTRSPSASAPRRYCPSPRPSQRSRRDR